MSEARANANQASGTEVPINGAGGEASPIDFPQILPGQSVKVPETEAEAEEFMKLQLGHDPEKIRAAGREFMARMERMADSMQSTQPTQPTPANAGSAVAQEVAPQVAQPAVQPPVAPPQAAQTSAPVQAPAPPVQAPARTPAPASQAQQQAQAQAMPWPPPGYLPVPEGLYTWTPETWGNRPLHCVPDRAIERERQATILIAILMAPAFARNRAGRVVSLPEGARVAIHAGIAWGPVIPLAKGTEGRPVICARPSLTPSGEPVRYDLGDGAHEWGIEITFDPDPKNPGYPRLIDLETVKGARQDTGDGE